MAVEQVEFQLPREAQEQVDLAEQLHEALFPTVETPAEPDSTHEEPVVPPTSPPAASEEQPVVPPEESEEKYRDRYMSLKGKYDAEVPRMAADLRELKQQLTQLTQTKPQETTPPVDTVVNERIEKLRTEYGDDFIEDWKALIANEIKSAIEPIKTQTLSVEESQTQLAQREFVSQLSKAAPQGWENLWDSHVAAKNGVPAPDPKFVEFLAKTDPNGFYTYGQILEDANTNWDNARMAKVFSIYTELNKVAVPPVAAPTTLQQPVPSVNPSQQAMVAPNRSVSQPAPAPDDTKIWSKADISQFQTDDRMGKYTPEQSEALWNDLMLAPAQNRIR